MEIKTQLIPVGHPNRPGIKIKPIAVVIHYTANDSPAATDTANVKYASRAYKRINGVNYEADGKTKFRCGSAQWYIDQDSATVAIPAGEVAWGCGDKQLPRNNGCNGQTPIARDTFHYKQNYLTINYEICNNADWNKAVANAIEIVAKDMIRFNINVNMMFRHHDISGKNCPAPFVSNPQAWINFKQAVANKINQLKGITSQQPSQTTVTPTSTMSTSIPNNMNQGVNIMAYNLRPICRGMLLNTTTLECCSKPSNTARTGHFLVKGKTEPFFIYAKCFNEGREWCLVNAGVEQWVCANYVKMIP